jgi:geranylgeranylglycerol-phosphate geranylgeranyltransferase
MSDFGSMIVVGRPVNQLIIFLSVFVGGYLLKEVPDLNHLFIAALGAMLIGGFGNTINDAVDHRSDAVNKPYRPIPSGKLSVKRAYAGAVIQLIMGLVGALAAGMHCFKIALLAALMLAGYAFVVKGIPLVANIWIAYISALSFVYAMAVVDSWEWEQISIATAGAVFVFLFHFAREILKDIEDIQGDLASGIKTFPIIAGVGVSKSMIVAIWALLFVALVAAHSWLELSGMFLAAALILVALPLVIMSVLIFFANSIEQFNRLQIYLKVLMPLGLMVLLVARYTV